MTNAQRIDRRTVLRGVGAAVALPMLEAMTPAQSALAARAATEKPPLRLAFLYVPNGMHMPDWTPSKTGENFDLKPILEPLAAHKKDLTVLSGLTLNGARALGDGGGDHARSVAAFLTGAHPRKTSGADIKNGVSVDQVAAEHLGKVTRFPSLELGCERSAQAGRCDSGYSCVYTSNMSWRSPTSPMAKEIDPRAVFDRLFGGNDKREQAASRAKRDERRKSVLDFVAEEAGDLRRRLGVKDKQKLDEYLYAVREIEKRIQAAEKLEGDEADVPDYPRPAGMPREFDEHVSVMLDLMVLAMQTDSTRVLTFMYTNAGSNRSYRDLGVRQGHHSLSHHGNNREKQAMISKINRRHVSLFKRLLDRMKAVKEGDRSLLDNSLVMYGSGIGDGNRHNHDNLPIVLAGQGAGTVKPGRHVQYQRETPLTNLYVSLLDRVGAKVKSLGDSTGRLKGLEG